MKARALAGLVGDAHGERGGASRRRSGGRGLAAREVEVQVVVGAGVGDAAAESAVGIGQRAYILAVVADVDDIAVAVNDRTRAGIDDMLCAVVRHLQGDVNGFALVDRGIVRLFFFALGHAQDEHEGHKGQDDFLHCDFLSLFYLFDFWFFFLDFAAA